MANLANMSRPSTFGSAIGEAARLNGEIIRNQVRTGKISHTYLMTGLKGSGKTTTARTLARALNCLDLKDGEPCGFCKNCQAIQKGESMDVKEVDAARNNGVDFAKSIEEDASYQPIEMPRKVYILDECHCLTNDAFSSLLKLIEEPPEWVVFIFCTTDPQKMPATIRSRCQEYRFKAVSLKEMTAHLIRTAAEYGARLDEGGAEVIARHSGGSVRDALMSLEICLGEEADVTAERANAILGIESWQQIFMLLNAIIYNNKAFIINSVDRYFAEGRRISDVITDCIRAVTDRLRFLAGAEVEGNDEYIGLVSSLDLDENLAFELADAMREVFEKIRYSADKGMLTVSLLRAAAVRASSFAVRLEGAEKRITELENLIANIGMKSCGKAEPDEIKRVKKANPIAKTEPATKAVELPDIFSFDFFENVPVSTPSSENSEKDVTDKAAVIAEKADIQEDGITESQDEGGDIDIPSGFMPSQSYEGFMPGDDMEIPIDGENTNETPLTEEPEPIYEEEKNNEPTTEETTQEEQQDRASGMSLDDLFSALNTGATPEMKLYWECNTNSFLAGLVGMCEKRFTEKEVILLAPSKEIKEAVKCCLLAVDSLDCVRVEVV